MPYISVLPVEILTEIFLLYVIASRNHPPSAAFVVSQVCRHWRAVATGAPKLWNSLFLISPEMAAAMCVYSKHLPLQVQLECKPGKPHRINGLLPALQSAQRVRTLTITGHVQMEVYDMLCQPAPHLEQLIIISDATAFTWIPDEIFGGQAPHLTFVYIANCDLFGVPAALRNTKQLSLAGLCGGWEHLADILEGFHALSWLYLKNWIFIGDQVAHDLPSLKSLRKLNLEDDVGTMCTFLTSFILPPQACVFLRVFRNGFADVVASSILTHIDNHLSQQLDVGLISLTVLLDDDTGRLTFTWRSSERKHPVRFQLLVDLFSYPEDASLDDTYEFCNHVISGRRASDLKSIRLDLPGAADEDIEAVHSSAASDTDAYISYMAWFVWSWRRLRCATGVGLENEWWM